MVPIVEGWASTYENPSIVSEQERHIHFGQFDHVRYYGADIRDRAAGQASPFPIIRQLPRTA